MILHKYPQPPPNALYATTAAYYSELLGLSRLTQEAFATVSSPPVGEHSIPYYFDLQIFAGLILIC